MVVVTFFTVLLVAVVEDALLTAAFGGLLALPAAAAAARVVRLAGSGTSCGGPSLCSEALLWTLRLTMVLQRREEKRDDVNGAGFRIGLDGVREFRVIFTYS